MHTNLPITLEFVFFTDNTQDYVRINDINMIVVN